MITVLCIVFLIMNLTKRRNKYIYILTLVLMWVIMTFITGNADEDIYLSRYNYASEWALNSELLFQYINVLCNKIGLSFTQYKGMIAFIYITVVGNTIWKLSKYPNSILILFFLCPFPLNVSQLRFALASAFLIFSYRYLINDDSKEIKKHFFSINEWKYIGCVVLATLIHTVAIWWLFLILVKRMSIKQTIIFTSVFSAFLYFVFNPSSIYWVLTKIGAASRMSAYFTAEYQESSFRHFGMATVQVLYIVLICIGCCVLIQKNKKRNNQIVSALLKYNIFELSVLAFIFRYTSEMYRPVESIMLLNYIIISNSCDEFNLLRMKGKKIDFLLKTLLLCLVFGSFILKIYLFNYDLVWKPMFF